MRNRAIALATAIMNPPLWPQVRYLEGRRAVLSETEDAEMQDTAYMALEAAEIDLRARIRAARQAAGIPTVSLAEAEELRARLLTGGVA
jgi:hypothetical protein